MKLDQLKSRIESSRELDFGGIFSDSIELFKKVWVQGLVTFLIMMACIMPFYLIIYIPMFAAGFNDPQSFESDQPPVWFAVLMIVFMPIFLLAVTTISNGLMAAFYRICKLKDKEEMGKDDYFRFLKGENLKKSFVLGLYATGLTFLGALACGLGLIYVMVPVSLFPVFLAFREDLTPSEIVKASFALGNKNWLVIFGLLLVCGFLANLGVIACYIGLFFTAMFGKIPMYFVYKNSLGFDADEQHEQPILEA